MLIALGDWEEAELYLRQAVEMLRPQGSSWYAAYPSLMLGRLRLCQGKWEEASRLLEESLAIAGPGEDRQALQQAQSWLAEIDLLEGRPEAALDRLEPLVRHEAATLPLLLPPLALGHLELGRQDRAVELAGEATRLAAEQHERLLLMDALRVLGTVLSRRNECEEAKRVLDEGLELARSVPYPYAHARILEEIGMILAQQGGGDQKPPQLREALATFKRLGAKKDVERMEQELAALDQPTNPAT